MKIPIGYGECRLIVRWAFDGTNYSEENFYFNHISGSTFEPVAVMNEYETINHRNIQRIDGYHLNFKLKLIDEDIGTGEQGTLTKFLAYFYDNIYIDGTDGVDVLGHELYLDLFSGGPTSATEDYNHFELGKMFVTAQTPKIEDISINKGAGQYLLLNCRSLNMLSKQNMRDFWATYKYSDGGWGTTLPPQEKCFGVNFEEEERISTSVFAEEL